MDRELISNVWSRFPRVLLLGQEYLGKDRQYNPLFAAFGGVFNDTPQNYWLTSEDQPDIRAKKFLTIDRTAQIAQEASYLLRSKWTCVFTSCIDSTTRQQLEIPNNRLVVQITDPAFDRVDRNNLTLIRLFGTVERQQIEELPPLNSASLRRRRTDAAAMLSKLPEIITPTGSLFIEGWNPLPDGDWLRPRDLDKALVSFLPRQVLIFGLTLDQIAFLEEDEDFGELVRQGGVTLLQDRLADILALMKNEGFVNLDSIPSEPGRFIAYKTLRRKIDSAPSLANENILPSLPLENQLTTIEIRPLEWRKLTQAITIIEKIDPTEPLSESKEDQYHEFRAFLADGASSPHWERLSHFAFRRHTLKKLRDMVFRFCTSDTPQDYLIVLHGPSGSGKTTLLQMLALDVRRTGLPAIYLDDNRQFFDYGSVIDEFCSILEAQGSSAPVVVIFDALERDETYVNLARHLSGRGRKCLIVGSAYSWQVGSSSRRPEGRKQGLKVHTISLPPQMDTKERTDLLAHIGEFIPKADIDLAPLLRLSSLEDNFFFAILYRSLPETRRRIERGIINEISEGAERIQDGIEKHRKQEYAGMTLMESKLRDALQNHLDILTVRMESTDSDREEYEIKDSILLINAVMLASKVGQSLPISLALRLIRNNFHAYARSIPDDIIVEHASREGTLSLRARHQLEADIWIRHRLPREADVVDLLRHLVLQVRANEVSEDQSAELDFVVKTLQAFGPQGPDRFRLRHSYDKIAGIIEELRSRYRRVHPRLLLLGSNAVREWVQVLQRGTGAQNDDGVSIGLWVSRLQEAEEGLLEAIDVVFDSAERPLRGAPRRLLATLETEQACILGVRIGSIHRLTRKEELVLPTWQAELNSHYAKARAAWLRALGYAEENIHALDTACWISGERLKAGGLSDEQRAEVLAHWSEIIDRYFDVDVPPSHMDKRDQREMELSRALGSRSRFEGVVKRLEKRNSAAVYALTARFLANDNNPDVARIYLEENCGERILKERSLIVLYFRLWWLAKTGFTSFFPDEQIVLSFRREDWLRLREICEARLRCEGEQENGTTLFLEGCALMHLDLTTQALQVFNRLDSIDIGGFRRARVLLLLANDSGEPREMNGEYRGQRKGSYKLAWCDELGINVSFNPVEHGLKEQLREGKTIGPFCIALNYRGPYALPLYRIKSRPAISAKVRDEA